MDKVCAVFGGSRGIGKAVAQLMAQKGYRLAIISRNLEVAKATAGELGGRYRNCLRRGARVQVLELQSRTSGLPLMYSGLPLKYSSLRPRSFVPCDPSLTGALAYPRLILRTPDK